MVSSFDRWEKDPFFSAAEEVQESADRMESTYRTWIHAMKDTTGAWKLDELRRDLQITLGTTKWQLEEFGRAAGSSYSRSSTLDDAKDRHCQFIIAIDNQITKVERSLNDSTVSQGKPPLPWVRLDEGEQNELALFLSGSLSSANKTLAKVHGEDQAMENSKEADPRQPMNEHSKSSSHLTDLCRVEGPKEKVPGHRRTASASADTGSWKIVVADDAFSHDSSSVKPDDLPPRKIPISSGFLNTMESSISQLKWSKNGYNKLKQTNRHQEAYTALPRSQNLTIGVNTWHEESKSCLGDYDDYYDKHLYGWHGNIRRQLQSSQYHMQYSRPVQVMCSIFLLFCLIVLLALHAI